MYRYDIDGNTVHYYLDGTVIVHYGLGDFEKYYIEPNLSYTDALAKIK